MNNLSGIGDTDYMHPFYTSNPDNFGQLDDRVLRLPKDTNIPVYNMYGMGMGPTVFGYPLLNIAIAAVALIGIYFIIGRPPKKRANPDKSMLPFLKKLREGAKEDLKRWKKKGVQEEIDHFQGIVNDLNKQIKSLE